MNNNTIEIISLIEQINESGQRQEVLLNLLEKYNQAVENIKKERVLLEQNLKLKDGAEMNMKEAKAVIEDEFRVLNDVVIPSKSIKAWWKQRKVISQAHNAFYAEADTFQHFLTLVKHNQDCIDENQRVINSIDINSVLNEYKTEVELQDRLRKKLTNLVGFSVNSITSFNTVKKAIENANSEDEGVM